MRTITTEGVAGVKPPAHLGAASQLAWLKIADLVVDPRYQRDISKQGRANIRKIAETFNWAYFAPVIVSPVEGGKYAIVDGQHRCTAAALVGIEQVPCAVIFANPAQQAAAFKAINGQVTRLHGVQLFHAALAAGDPEARRLAAVCAKAGVSIHRTPDAPLPNKTLAVTALHRSLLYGDQVVRVALRALVAACPPDQTLLRAPIILALSTVLFNHQRWLRDEERVVDAVAALGLIRLWDEAAAKAGGDRRLTVRHVLQEELERRLSSTFDLASAA